MTDDFNIAVVTFLYELILMSYVSVCCVCLSV